MIKVLSGAMREQEPALFRQMFEGRAVVFHERLGWEVQVVDGQEMDHYDQRDDIIYLVSLDDDNFVQGSLRLLPTVGETMLKNEFKDFFDEPVDVESPTIWECTRFCVSPPRTGTSAEATRRVSTELLIGLSELSLASGIDQIMGVIMNSSTRIYKRIGWAPEVIAESYTHRGHILTGLWDVSEESLAAMREYQQRFTRAVAAQKAA